MKIRIKGNSIRYRLTKTEVEDFCKNGYYENQTGFNSVIFKYALKAIEGTQEMSADFDADKITIYFPSSQTKVWVTSDRVGYQNNMELNNGQQLLLVVEKDFVCLDERGEDESDNYPNPKA